MIRGALVVLAAAAMALGASPAFAKGPSHAGIEGPGIASPIELPGPNATTIGPDLAQLVIDSGLFTGTCRTCEDRLRARPSGAVGPRYTITYTMGDASGGKDQVVQYVFPFAEPDPVMYLPAAQQFLGRTTVGGWFSARPRLRQLLIRLGVPPQQSFQQASPRRDSTWMVTVLSIAAAVVLLTAVALVMRRERNAVVSASVSAALDSFTRPVRSIGMVCADRAKEVPDRHPLGGSPLSQPLP
jgi:hypothetical protein